MTRKLTLKKETLVELGTDELRSVAGAAVTTGRGVPTVNYCPLTGEWPTLPVLSCVVPG
jgi:hypothetical protein